MLSLVVDLYHIPIPHKPGNCHFVGIAAHYLLMFVADPGILGAATAFGLVQYSGLASLLAIIWARKLHMKTWGGWS